MSGALTESAGRLASLSSPDGLSPWLAWSSFKVVDLKRKYSVGRKQKLLVLLRSGLRQHSVPLPVAISMAGSPRASQDSRERK